MRYRIKPSNFAGIIANQLGDIEANVRGRVTDEVRRLVTQFANQCPPPNELTKIVNVKNSLATKINNFQGRIRPFRRSVSKLEKVLSSLIKLIKILKLIPIPTATGTPPTGATSDVGGLLFAIPVKITNKYADLLRLTSELAASVEDDIAACNGLLKETETDLNNIKNELEVLNPSIEECTTNQGLSAEQLKQIREAAEGLNKEGTGGTFTDVSFRSVNGKDYKLSVLTDPNSPSIAPKRFAVAKDNIGVIVLRGQSSFASSTEVLIEELKFRIDNQLP